MKLSKVEEQGVKIAKVHTPSNKDQKFDIEKGAVRTKEKSCWNKKRNRIK